MFANDHQHNKELDTRSSKGSAILQIKLHRLDYKKKTIAFFLVILNDG